MVAENKESFWHKLLPLIPGYKSPEELDRIAKARKNKSSKEIALDIARELDRAAARFEKDVLEEEMGPSAEDSAHETRQWVRLMKGNAKGYMEAEKQRHLEEENAPGLIEKEILDFKERINTAKEFSKTPSR
jgi:hypothetical protein